MSSDTSNPHLLEDDEFEDLEEVLVSDAVPEDCMDLEMLDGYLAAVIASPRPIGVEEWLPGVWSAHGDAMSFGSGSRMQRAIRLVRGYYNELVTTIGEPEGWEPFCYAVGEGDTLEIGEEWIEGFSQGLELWPADWETLVPEAAAQAVRAQLDGMLSPWMDEDEAQADDEARLQRLEDAATAVAGIVAKWRECGLPAPSTLSVEGPAAPAAAQPGRNEACSCGSGKKFKKCCGAPK